MRMSTKKRILTGDRPTGRLHIGHYVGSLANRVKLQDEYDTYILIADLQALTDNFETPKEVSRNVRELVIDYLSIGLDPKKVAFVVQSQVPELTELTFYYMNLVSLARLERNPTVKDEMKQNRYGSNVPMGFLTYPVSQAADITGFLADLVPVGEDQLPVIEQTNEIVDKFNRLYGKTLKNAKGLVSEFPRLPGTDGKSKMGKSLDNFILLSEPKESLRKKVMSMYTDPNRVSATTPGKVGGNPVFTYHDAFNENKKEVEELKKRYRAGTVGDVEVKEKLLVALEKFIAPIREKRAKLEKEPKYIDKIIADGAKKGRAEVILVTKKVRVALGLKNSL
jgi:tryptophanyl-tRNA synthetase